MSPDNALHSDGLALLGPSVSAGVSWQNPNHILVLLLLYIAALSGMASYLDERRIAGPQWSVVVTSIMGSLLVFWWYWAEATTLTGRAVNSNVGHARTQFQHEDSQSCQRQYGPLGCDLQLNHDRLRILCSNCRKPASHNSESDIGESSQSATIPG